MYLFAINLHVFESIMPPPSPLPRSLHLRRSPIRTLSRCQPKRSSCRCCCQRTAGCLCSCCTHVIVSPTIAFHPARSCSTSSYRLQSPSSSLSPPNPHFHNTQIASNRVFFTTSLFKSPYQKPVIQLTHFPHPNNPTQPRPFSSTSKMTQEYKLKGITSLADLKSSTDKIEVDIEGISDGKVLLVNLDGKVHALSPRCTHYGAPLKNGVVSPDGRLTCPWHGGMYRPAKYFRFEEV